MIIFHAVEGKRAAVAATVIGSGPRVLLHNDLRSAQLCENIRELGVCECNTRNHKEAIAGMDFFTVPTATMNIVYGFFIIHHDRTSTG